MKIKTFEFNPLGVNTYVLHDNSGECVVIDAACLFPDEKELLLDYILDHDLIVKHLINTHLHFDHLFGVNFIASQFHLKLEAHRDDLFLLDNLPQQLAQFGINATNDFRPQIGHFLSEGDTVSFGHQQLKIMHVPGHSPGSVVFYNESGQSLFAGDVLFNGSIGRTDLAGGDFNQLFEAIRQKLFVLPGETVVYPGHGPKTSIGHEKKNNPFVGIEN